MDVSWVCWFFTGFPWMFHEFVGFSVIFHEFVGFCHGFLRPKSTEPIGSLFCLSIFEWFFKVPYYLCFFCEMLLLFDWWLLWVVVATLCWFMFGFCFWNNGPACMMNLKHCQESKTTSTMAPSTLCYNVLSIIYIYLSAPPPPAFFHLASHPSSTPGPRRSLGQTTNRWRRRRHARPSSRASVGSGRTPAERAKLAMKNWKTKRISGTSREIRLGNRLKVRLVAQNPRLSASCLVVSLRCQGAWHLSRSPAMDLVLAHSLWSPMGKSYP